MVSTRAHHCQQAPYMPHTIAELQLSLPGEITITLGEKGSKVIPFPRELSEQLTREMLHVFEIDVGVFLTPASGKALMAIIMENRRAIAVVKNKAQKDFIMQQLTEGVRTLNLVADRRPPKPQELTEWEGGQRQAGAKASGATPPAPATPATPAALPAALPAPPAPPAPAPGKASAPGVPPPLLPPPVVTHLAAASAGSGPAPPPPAASSLAAFGSAVLR